MDVFPFFFDQYLKYLKEEGNILKFEFPYVDEFRYELQFIKGIFMHQTQGI